MLNELSKSIRFDNASKGFDPTEGGVNRYLLLTISEICEAQEELRDGKEIQEIYYEMVKIGHKVIDPNVPDEGQPIYGLKPCGFPVEIADAAIRILDICGKFNINLEVDCEVPDYEDRPLDDWLLGICEYVALAGNFEPIKEFDFEDNLHMALGCLFLMCEKHNIMIMDVIQEKLKFNKTRPPKHGRKF